MAKLYFRYGAMNAGKSAHLLQIEHKYRESGFNVLVMEPQLDTREEGVIASRPLQEVLPCELIKENTNLFNYLQGVTLLPENKLECILIDEAQFLTKEHIYQLTEVVDKLDIPVMCFGLKNSYIPGELFEGTTALLYYADDIVELKSICPFCGKKALYNLRIVDGVPVYTGNPVQIGDIHVGEEYYISTCRKHFKNPPCTKEGVIKEPRSHNATKK